VAIAIDKVTRQEEFIGALVSVNVETSRDSQIYLRSKESVFHSCLRYRLDDEKEKLNLPLRTRDKISKTSSRVMVI
jgi:hypothetical protein